MKKIILVTLLLSTAVANAYISSFDIKRVQESVVIFQSYDGSTGIIGGVLEEGVGSVLSLSLPCFSNKCRIERLRNHIAEQIHSLRIEATGSRDRSEVRDVNAVVIGACQMRNSFEPEVYLFEEALRAKNCEELLVK